MPRQNANRSLSITSHESYGAVIIADMVAEVQTDGESQPTGHHDSTAVGHNSSRDKEKVNLAYDDKADATPAAVVSVDNMEIVNLGLAKTNGGSNLSKGVILNAQFGPPDPKVNGKDGGKAIELNNSHSVTVLSDAGTKDSKKQSQGFVAELQEMSVPRKIAFGFSFLPSIMFVLCFSVILPCEKKLPCVQDMWTVTLDNTEVTSDLKVLDSLIFTFANRSTEGLQSLDSRSGNVRWTTSVESKILYMDCGKLTEDNGQSCFVMDTSGNYSIYNAATGVHIQKLDHSSFSGSSKPVILPDCDGDGVAEVAFGNSNRGLTVLVGSNKLFTVDIKGCDSVPSNLTTWTRGNETDLVFVCQKGTNDLFMRMRISEDIWTPNKEAKVEHLYTRPSEDLMRLVMLAIDDRFVVWTREEVTVFNSSGEIQWTNSSLPHFGKKRFLLYGNFNNIEKQIVLLSGDIMSSLQVTMLDVETGETTWRKSVANAEVSDAILIHGEKKDFALVHIRKVQRDLKSEALAHISGIPSTLASLLSEENNLGDDSATNFTEAILSDEIAFMSMDSTFLHPIENRKVPFWEGELYTTTLTAFFTDGKEGKDLSIVALKEPIPSATVSSQLRNIQVANWDISQNQNRQCVLK